MKNDQPKLARRGFLAGAGILAAAAGAVTLTRPTADTTLAAAPTVPDATGDAAGYRVSEHIRKYYKTTLI